MVEHDGIEMHAEMARIARTIKIRSWPTPTGRLLDYYRFDTASDPKIEWPLIADYDIELVAATREGDYTDGDSTANHA